jgi:fumarate hydratase class II
MNVAPVDGATFITHRTRSETDSFGPIDVAADRYWGAQTEQSRRNFRTGQDRMPMPIVHALAMVKLAAAVRQPHCHHGRGSQGHFELNVYKPLLAYCMMHSLQLLADVARPFTEHCVEGIRANEKRIQELMERSLMLVTALAPKIGYDNAAKVAKSADARGTSWLYGWIDPRRRIRSIGSAEQNDAPRGSIGTFLAQLRPNTA